MRLIPAPWVAWRAALLPHGALASHAPLPEMLAPTSPMPPSALLPRPQPSARSCLHLVIPCLGSAHLPVWRSQLRPPLPILYPPPPGRIFLRQVVALVLKYGDNVLKNFSTACSVVLGTIISAHLFGFVPARLFLWGALLVVRSKFTPRRDKNKIPPLCRSLAPHTPSAPGLHTLCAGSSHLVYRVFTPAALGGTAQLRRDQAQLPVSPPSTCLHGQRCARSLCDGSNSRVSVGNQAHAE